MDGVYQEFGRMWKERVFGYFKIQYHYFPELTEKKHERYRDSRLPSQESNPAAPEQDTGEANTRPSVTYSLSPPYTRLCARP
jgi:hypothetical protein